MVAANAAESTPEIFVETAPSVSSGCGELAARQMPAGTPALLGSTANRRLLRIRLPWR